MKFSFYLAVVTGCAGMFCHLGAQPLSYADPSRNSPGGMFLAPEASEPGEQNSDPAYKPYRKGYNLILEENWSEARKVLAEVIKQYPKSTYIDDATYWSAFALKHIDKDKAKKEYKSFILRYPRSSYYDDAVADYSELNKGRALWVRERDKSAPARVFVFEAERDGRSGKGAVVTIGTDSLAVHKERSKGKTSTSHSFEYRYSFAPSIRQVERQFRRAQNMQFHVSRQLPLERLEKWETLPWGDEKIDPDVRLKMDALYALGETKEDSVSFRTLRDVAVDRTQPTELRQAAMDALSNFTRFDVLPVFLQVVQKDTSEEIQNAAIDYIGQLSKDKKRSVETLKELYSAVPRHRTEQLQTVLSSIAEIGNDAAVDVLAQVARTDNDYDLRSDAIYYLGNIGGERARIVLYEILKGK